MSKKKESKAKGQQYFQTFFESYWLQVFDQQNQNTCTVRAHKQSTMSLRRIDKLIVKIV